MNKSKIIGEGKDKDGHMYKINGTIEGYIDK